MKRVLALAVTSFVFATSVFGQGEAVLKVIDALREGEQTVAGPQTGFKKKVLDREYSGIAHMEVSFSFFLQPKMEGEEELLTDTCSRACQGKQHKEHLDCNSSCDKACEYEHSREVRAATHFAQTGAGDRTNQMREIRAMVDEFAREYGVPAANYGTTGSFEAIDKVKGLLNNTIKLEPGHPSAGKACTSVSMIWHERAHSLRMQAAAILYVVGADGQKVQVTNMSHAFNLATIYLTDAEPIMKDTVACACKRDKTVTGLPWNGDTFLAYNPFGYGGLNSTPIAIGENLGHVTVEGGYIDYPTGTTLVPQDSKDQQMVLVEPFRPGDYEWFLNIINHRSTVALEGAGSPIPGKVRLRVLCAQMEKKEPTSKSQFRFSPGRDPVATALAKMTFDSRSRGPWDQMRMWIHTDLASFEKIEERLLPCPSKGRYRELASEVARIESKPGALSAIEKNITPDILFSAGVRQEPTEWGVQVIARRDPKSLISAAKSYGPKLFEFDDKVHLQYAAWLVAALTLNGNRDAQEAGLMILRDSLPKQNVQDFDKLGGFEGLRAILADGTPAQMNTALGIVEKFGVSDFEDDLKALAATVNSEEIRLRAKKILGGSAG